MKTIHLTENDILDIVNKVIYEQKTLNTTQPDPNNLTPEDLIKRFIDGVETDDPSTTHKKFKDRTYIFKDKKGSSQDAITFLVKNVQYIDTESESGSSAIVSGIIYGQKEDETKETSFELICGSYNDFKLVKYKGLDKNRVKVEQPKKIETGQSEPVVLSKPKLPLEVIRFTYESVPFEGGPDTKKGLLGEPTELEDLGGLGIFLYMDIDNRVPHRGGVTDESKWMSFYDGENKIRKELEFLSDRYSNGRTVFYLYPFDATVDDKTALNAMFNFISPQIAQDLKDYGVRKAPSDYMKPNKYKYQIIKTKGKQSPLRVGKSLATPKPLSSDYKVLILQY